MILNFWEVGGKLCPLCWRQSGSECVESRSLNTEAAWLKSRWVALPWLDVCGWWSGWSRGGANGKALRGVSRMAELCCGSPPSQFIFISLCRWTCSSDSLYLFIYLFLYLQPLLAPTSVNAKPKASSCSTRPGQRFWKSLGFSKSLGFWKSLVLHHYTHTYTLLYICRYSNRTLINRLKHFSKVKLKSNGRQVHCMLTAVILTVGNIKKHWCDNSSITHCETHKHTLIHTCGSNYTCLGRK